MRLACVKHAASVRSEPGSNSQVHLRTNHKRQRFNEQTRTQPVPHPSTQGREHFKAYCQRNQDPIELVRWNPFKIHRTAPNQANQPSPSQNHPGHQSTHPQPTDIHPQTTKGAANVSLPSRYNCQRTSRFRAPATRAVGSEARFLVGAPGGVNKITMLAAQPRSAAAERPSLAAVRLSCRSRKNSSRVMTGSPGCSVRRCSA